MTTPITDTHTAAGAVATGLWAKTATGTVAATRRSLFGEPRDPQPPESRAQTGACRLGLAATWSTISAPLTAPIGTRFSTGEDLELLNGPASAPGGAITVTPGVDNLPALTNASPAGSTFYLLAGDHVYDSGNQFDQTAAKAGNTYIGAPGARINGRWFNRYCFTGTATNVTIRYIEVCNFTSPFDEFVINHECADNWTVEYCNVHSNAAAGVGMGNNNVLRYSWLHHNQQYGWSQFKTPVNNAKTSAITNVTIDHCEVNGCGDLRDEFQPTGDPTFRGRNGTCKFWDCFGMTITNNWLHDNLQGVWADTNDIQLLMEGNLVEDIWGESLFYEISYNFMVRYNTFRRNCIGFGLRSNENNDNFPRPAIYISDSGSEPRVDSLYKTQSEITNNRFINNWDDIGLWQAPERFCNSPVNTSAKIWMPLGGQASLVVCNAPTPKTLTVTLTSGSAAFTVTSGTFEWTDEGRPVTGTGIPADTTIREQLNSNGFSDGYVDATHGFLSKNATASGSVTITLAAGSINTDPYFYDCRWHTQQVKIHHNQFDHNQTEVLGSNTLLTGDMTTGKQAVISIVGSASPPFSPYLGDVVQQAITFNQGNVWSNNAYRGDYTHFMPFDTNVKKTYAQWQAAPYNQDAGSTYTGTAPTSGVTSPWTKPNPPTSITATAGNGQARVAFTPPLNTGSDTVIGYTVTSSPGGITATSMNGPIVVTGLTNTTAYTFTVKTRTAIGASVASSASNSVTPTTGSSLSATTAPWHPNKATARKRTSTTAEVTFVPPNVWPSEGTGDGGATITGYTVTSSPGGITGTGAIGPITVSGLTSGQTYTFTVTATNAAGTSPPCPATAPITL